jgi:hypothetical protein
MLEFLQNLNLPAMFAVTFLLTLIPCWAILIVTRLATRWSGFDATKVLPLHANVLTAAASLFALMLAFSAASIWNDTLQARAAVQREANALENIIGLANGLPQEVRDTVRNSVVNYAQGVVERDWPAMAQKVQVGDWTYANSDRILVHLIDYLSIEAASSVTTPILSALFGQLFEVRSARLARLTLASSGLTSAQWFSLVVLSLFVFVMLATLHNHQLVFQVIVMNLYAFAAAGAFLVIVAHNGPFVGAATVSPAPLQELATRPLN